MIKLFKSNETNFSHDGVEVLDDIVISSYTNWKENSSWVSESKFKKDFDKSYSSQAVSGSCKCPAAKRN